MVSKTANLPFCFQSEADMIRCEITLDGICPRCGTVDCLDEEGCKCCYHVHQDCDCAECVHLVETMCRVCSPDVVMLVAREIDIRIGAVQARVRLCAMHQRDVEDARMYYDLLVKFANSPDYRAVDDDFDRTSLNLSL